MPDKTYQYLDTKLILKWTSPLTAQQAKETNKKKTLRWSNGMPDKTYQYLDTKLILKWTSPLTAQQAKETNKKNKLLAGVMVCLTKPTNIWTPNLS